MCHHNRPPSLLVLLITFTLGTPFNSSAGEKQQRQQQQSGIGWAMQAVAALTGGNPVSSVNESGSVTLTIGSDQEQGTITLQSTGVMTNQVTISTNAGNRSETRSWDGSRPSGQWTGLDGQQHPMARINCWTDAVWFFPALSLLSDYADPTLTFADLGQQQYNGGTVEHIQVSRVLSTLPQPVEQIVQEVSTVDYYLDSQTALPVAMGFWTYGDHNVDLSIPVVIFFSQYQSANGFQVPVQVTRLLNGLPLQQINITSITPN